jgi:hypothetical protein
MQLLRQAKIAGKNRNPSQLDTVILFTMVPREEHVTRRVPSGHVDRYPKLYLADIRLLAEETRMLYYLKM